MSDAEIEVLCAQHRRPLLAYAFTCSRDLHLAEDIVQETMLIAVRKREQYFPEADFGSWLISIARNVWFRERDKRRLAERAGAYLHEQASQLFTCDQYGDDDRWAREKTALSGCVEKLAADDRRLIDLHFAGGCAYGDISRQLKRSLSWVKVRMFRVRATLLRCVRTQLGSASTHGG